MRTAILTAAVSAIALMAAAPGAYAETNVGVNTEAKAGLEVSPGNNASTPDMPAATGEDVQRGLEKTGNALEGAARTTGNVVENFYYDLKHVFTDDASSKKIANEYGGKVTIKTRTTATGMIGKDVLDSKGESVATVEDIIVDGSGAAKLVILRDGGFFGMGGKLVAFDYDKITSRAASGDIIMPVTENLLDQVSEFSYDQKASGKVRLIPANGVSVNALLDGHIQNSQNQNVADIDNIAFVNGKADYVVVSFNEILGMGGDTAIMDFDQLKIASKQDGKVDLTLSAKQSAEFEAFKEDMKQKG